MKIVRYAEPGSTSAFTLGNQAAHHWLVDVTGEEYLTVTEQFKEAKWNKQVRWFPNYVPGLILGTTRLEMHVIALDDRDATMIKLSL